ncbi:MAG: urease accessory UreF family protein [Burkholderiaceae bacterium]
MTPGPDFGPWFKALHLASPALPVGGFSYSAGLEAACAAEIAHDEASVQDWIRASLQTALERAEAPAWLLFYRAWQTSRWDELQSLNAWFLATRETLELRRESEQMGWSLVHIATDLRWGGDDARAQLLAMRPISYPTASAFACAAQAIPEELGVAAYCFAWLENQVTAALKTLPLGQAAGQRILTRLMEILPALIERARDRAEQGQDGIETLAPQLAILSARHETQYSRLFRS